MISIVIPVYNCEKYLSECIDSIIQQTYEDYEIIIVNDGSTDGKEKIIVNYKKKYPDKIISIYKKNGGTASALNEGILHMKGTWFKWLSADDRFHSKHALKDIIYLVSTIPRHHDYNKTRDLRNAELLHNFYGNGSSSLIHKSMIDKVGLFDDTLPYDEDLDFWLRACIKFRFTLYHLPIRSLDYRVHKETLTWKADADENLKLVKLIRRRYEQYLTDEQKEYIKKLHGTIPLRRRIIPVKVRSKIVRLYKKGM
jgi:glycosyltransferase involved in cell wall biosynthesis